MDMSCWQRSKSVKINQEFCKFHVRNSKFVWVAWRLPVLTWSLKTSWYLNNNNLVQTQNITIYVCLVSCRHTEILLDVSWEHVLRRAAEFQCEDFRRRVQSAAVCFKQMISTWEETTHPTYAWAWKTHSVSIKGPGRFSLSDRGPMDKQFCFLFCVRTIRAIGPTALWELFEGLRLTWERQRLRYWRPHGCNCDQRRHKELNGGSNVWSQSHAKEI